MLLGLVNDLSSIIGACERLVQTPVPLSYARHTSRFLTLYLWSLPMVLVADFTGPLLSLVSGFVCWCLFGILGACVYLFLYSVGGAGLGTHGHMVGLFVHTAQNHTSSHPPTNKHKTTKTSAHTHTHTHTTVSHHNPRSPTSHPTPQQTPQLPSKLNHPHNPRPTPTPPQRSAS